MTRLSFLVLCAALLCGCRNSGEAIVIASTTSLHDTGLLDTLVAEYRREHPGVRVSTLAVGSGEALELGRRGDADVLLVHSPEAEQKFVDEGRAAVRYQIMQNDFVVVGDSLDPANVRGASSASDAFRRIHASGSAFASRGDESGTHVKERAIWKAAQLDPATLPQDRYISVGQGMTETLRVADERGAYALTDISTFTTLAGALKLVVLFRGDPVLTNIYSVIAVRGSRSEDEAVRFANFLRSPQAQRIVAGYGAAQFGRPLFEPIRQ